MSEGNVPCHGENPLLPPEVVCFGMITPGVVLVVDRLPEHNTGTFVKQVAEFVSDDAAIVACLLRQWEVRSGLIGTALGDDPPGRKAAEQLAGLGILGEFRLSQHITTPLEVNVSDPTGARTYFWQRDPQVLATLDTAELSLMSGSQLLYVDWYDGDHILRPMTEAARLGIPVFLNLEHGHQDAETLARYGKSAAICQAVTDPAQKESDALAVARRLLEAGVGTALVTLAGDGCLAARRGKAVRAWAPTVKVVDGCGAGATFSAGLIYGYLKGWDLEGMVRFAVAAATLKCTAVGPIAFPLEEIESLASEVTVCLTDL